MSRLLIVSNRLPFEINIQDKIQITPSVGGLATGLKSFYKNFDSVWIGWTGINSELIPDDRRDELNQVLTDQKCQGVDLNNEEMELYYEGFSNNTLWPLCHYFPSIHTFEEKEWETYRRVNRKFADAICSILQPGDKIWIHDYHLMLLPQMIREIRDDVMIGYFHHIPFPSYEIFRILPVRNEILNGLLGADLIGFHTYDYERHFLNSVRSLLGSRISFNKVMLPTHISHVDTFPMGIDYERYNNESQACKKLLEESGEKKKSDQKVILSVDRLDYSKGIDARLLAYAQFLEEHPEMHGKVILKMIAVPSRTQVEQYQIMKTQIDELVGRINGQYAKLNWTPIHYYFQSFPFADLIKLYTTSDVCLVTPVRDGMNLVAKEYVACQTIRPGVLVLSEMAGAAKELGEAIIVNPSTSKEVADGIFTALTLSNRERQKRQTKLHDRVKRNTVQKWASDFISILTDAAEKQKQYRAKDLSEKTRKSIIEHFRTAKSRLVILDYDGTLKDYQTNPRRANPEKRLIALLDQIAFLPNTNLCIASGRRKANMQRWFGDKSYHLISENGVWMKENSKDWELRINNSERWKKQFEKILSLYTIRLSGSIVEQKKHALTWHFRDCDQELASTRLLELKDEISSMISNHNLEILEGEKNIEIKTSEVSKGEAVSKIYDEYLPDFCLVIGENNADESMFQRLNKHGYTIKVGEESSAAQYNISSIQEVKDLLGGLAEGYHSTSVE